MKIIHCVGRLKGGGAETQLRLFLEKSSETIQNIVVSYEMEDHVDVTYYQIDEKISLLHKWRCFYNICKNEKPDIVHIWLPAVFYIYGIPVLFINAKKILGVRSVYQLDSLRRYVQFLIYCFYRNVVSNTHIEDQKGLYQWLFKLKKYHFIPNAIKFDVMNESFQSKYGQEQETPFNLLFVGRLVKDKNVHTLLNSLKLIPEDNWKLTIVGTGPEKASLATLLDDTALNQKITFEDFTDDIITYYKSADALILPSTREGMPNVVFEAAVFDTILILSDIPQHKRWFTHQKNAFLFNPNESDELASCIKRAMSISVEQKMEFFSEVHKVLNELTKEKYIGRYTNLYNKLLNE